MRLVKVEFSESSKAVTVQVKIESDELTPEEVLQQTRDLFDKAQKVSLAYTLAKER